MAMSLPGGTFAQLTAPRGRIPFLQTLAQEPHTLQQASRRNVGTCTA